MANKQQAMESYNSIIDALNQAQRYIDIARMCVERLNAPMPVAEVAAVPEPQPPVEIKEPANTEVVAPPPPAPQKKPVKKQKPANAEPKTEAKGGQCAWTFSKGKEKGQTCGKATTSGSIYCGRHTNKDTKNKTEKKPTTKKLDLSSSSSSSSSAAAPARQVLEVVRTDDGHWLHTDTRFVFESDTHQVVVGKMSEHGVLELCDRDIQVCKQMNLEYHVPVNIRRSDKEEAVSVEPPVADIYKELVVSEAYEVEAAAADGGADVSDSDGGECDD
jgi:hypothetical protein